MWLALACTANAQGGEPEEQEPPGESNFTELSLEELMDIDVTSVSRRSQKRRLAPAAIYVMTSKQLMRSGATTVADALRTVPGLQVARIGASRWAISARGLGGLFSNKLLVMIDGRSVYTPLFSGTYWEVQDTLLEDIDRIEVIRGPGGALWGANAVNGVINIITKSARDTQGSLVSATVGTEELVTTAARHGGAIGDDGAYRIYVKAFSRDGQKDAQGDDADDGWQQLRGGFRTDWGLGSETELTVQGDVYRGISDEIFEVPSTTPPLQSVIYEEADLTGANILGRVRHRWKDGSESTALAYWDYTRRSDPIFGDTRNTAELDVQHEFATAGRHRLMVGGIYRYSENDIDPSAIATVNGGTRGDNLFSLFANDEITLVEDELTFSVGLKLEHNDYTGWEIQPDARLSWAIDDQHSVWAAVARAVRTPSRVEHDGQLDFRATAGPGSTLFLTQVSGNPGLKAEDLFAVDAGYRLQLDERFSLDIAAFYNDHQDLSTAPPGPPTGPPPVFVVPLRFENSREAQSLGFEVDARWAASPVLELAASYSFLHVDTHDNNSATATQADPAEFAPENQVHLQAGWAAYQDLRIDSTLSWIDRVRAFDIPAFTRLDTRLAWTFSEQGQLELVLQNLLDDRHPEFGQQGYRVPTEIERGAYLQVTFEF